MVQDLQSLLVDLSFYNIVFEISKMRRFFHVTEKEG